MKIFCKYCQFYKGTRKMEMYTPLEPRPFTDHVCGINNGSIWDLNKDNGCKHYQPKVKIGMIQRFLNIFK